MSSPTSPVSVQVSRKWPLWFWILIPLVPILFLGIMHQFEHRSALSEDWHVISAYHLDSNAEAPPAVDSDLNNQWQPISMPHEELGDWRKPTSAWLRIPLPKEQATSSKDWMLLIPSPMNANYSLWLSNVRFARAGHHDSTGVSMPKNPVIFEFSSLALKDGDREIYLRITRDFGGVNLNGIYLGPADALRDHADHVIFIKKTLIRAILIMMAGMAFAMFFIHLIRREHTTIYGWYALGLFVWLIHILNSQHETAVFGSLWFWYRVTYVTLAAYAIVALVFINRLIKHPQNRIETVLLLLFSIGAIFIIADPLGPESTLRFKTMLWTPATIAVGLYMLLRLGIGARRNPQKQVLALLVVTFLGVCVGIRDYLYNDLQLLPGGMLYLRHATGLILVIYSFVMIWRFAQEDREYRPTNPHPSNSTIPSSNQSAFLHSQSRLLQQEHDALERQLQQAMLDAEPSETTTKFNNNMQAARLDLQLIRDMMQSKEGSETGSLLQGMQLRLYKTALNQGIQLNWNTPLITDHRFLEGHFEFAVTRFIQTAMLDALAFTQLNSLSVPTNIDSTPGSASITVTIEAYFTEPSSTYFTKRAQMEAAARDLKGRLEFESSPGLHKVILYWDAPLGSPIRKTSPL